MKSNDDILGNGGVLRKMTFLTPSLWRVGNSGNSFCSSTFVRRMLCSCANRYFIAGWDQNEASWYSSNICCYCWVFIL